MSALVDLRAYFWKVPITFRACNQIFKSNPQRILKEAGPSEQISPVCFVTDKQNKTIEISIELSLELNNSFPDPQTFEKRPLRVNIKLLRFSWVRNGCARCQRTKVNSPGGGGLLPRILDRGVPRRFVDPNPI